MSYPVLINRGDDGPARHQFDARLLLIAVSMGQMTGFFADYGDAAGIRLGVGQVFWPRRRLCAGERDRALRRTAPVSDAAGLHCRLSRRHRHP